MNHRYDAGVRSVLRRYVPILTGLGVLVVAGCAADPALVPPNADLRFEERVEAAPPLSGRAAYEYHVLAGEMAIQRDRADIAAREYVAALEYSRDPALAKRAARIALFAGRSDLAYRAARAWADSEPDSLDAQRMVTRMALAAGDGEVLARHAPALVAAAASPDIGYRLLADGLSGAPESAGLAIETIRRLAEQNSDSAPAQHALGVVALRYGRGAIAARAAERTLALDDDWNDAILLQAGVWIQDGETERARTLIERLPGNAASRAEYHRSLARLLIEADQAEAALSEFEKALELQPDNREARYGLAVLSLSVGDLERARRAFTAVYEDGDQVDDAAYYLGSIAEEQQDYAEAQRWYQRVESGQYAFEAQLRAARMLYLQGDMAAARQRLADLRDGDADLTDQLYAAEAQLLLEADDPEAAIAVYSAALAEEPNSLDLLYGRSIAHERLGRIEAARADLQAMLEQEPDDPRALNALGYLLTNHSDDYERALDYIQRALAAEPDNPAIIDSRGWVAYRLGRLDEARRYLERAYSEYPDGEVAAHLGEVLWTQGRRDAARRIWADALSDAPDHPILNETVNRLDP